MMREFLRRLGLGPQAAAQQELRCDLLELAARVLGPLEEWMDDDR